MVSALSRYSFSISSRDDLRLSISLFALSACFLYFSAFTFIAGFIEAPALSACSIALSYWFNAFCTSVIVSLYFNCLSKSLLFPPAMEVLRSVPKIPPEVISPLPNNSLSARFFCSCLYIFSSNSSLLCK